MDDVKIEGPKNKKFVKIDSLAKEKIGLYKIFATNKFGSAEASWNVSLEGKNYCFRLLILRS